MPFDSIMKCINCGIATQRVWRHITSSLPSLLLDTLAQWLTIEVPMDANICHACYEHLSSARPCDKRLLGHTMLCITCGRSVLRCRHHTIENPNSLLQALPRSHPAHHQNINYLCHRCWTMYVRIRPGPKPAPRAKRIPKTDQEPEINLMNNKRARITTTQCVFNSCDPIVIKEELIISPEVVYVKSESVEDEDGYESNRCEDPMSIQVNLDVVKVEDLNPQQNSDYSNIPTKPEESQSKDIKKGVLNTKEAYILIEDCMKELERNNCYCRNCKTLLPSVDALEIHNSNVHSLLIQIDKYIFKRKFSEHSIIFYKQVIEKEITNNDHNYAKTRPTDVK